MAEFRRSAEAEWTGDLRRGKGRITGASGLFRDAPYSFFTRFGETPGTNPEELLAGAQAACFSMAFAGHLTSKGLQPERIHTHATCYMTREEGSGAKITRMHLVTKGKVPGVDNATFEQLAREAETQCPVANLLRCGLTIELEASLE